MSQLVLLLLFQWYRVTRSTIVTRMLNVFTNRILKVTAASVDVVTLEMDCAVEGEVSQTQP